MEPTFNFGRTLRHLMVSRGWGEGDLARAAGLSPELVSGFVQNIFPPTFDEHAKLAAALGLEPDDLPGAQEPCRVIPLVRWGG